MFEFLKTYLSNVNIILAHGFTISEKTDYSSIETWKRPQTSKTLIFELYLKNHHSEKFQILFPEYFKFLFWKEVNFVKRYCCFFPTLWKAFQGNSAILWFRDMNKLAAKLIFSSNIWNGWTIQILSWLVPSNHFRVSLKSIWTPVGWLPDDLRRFLSKQPLYTSHHGLSGTKSYVHNFLRITKMKLLLCK